MKKIIQLLLIAFIGVSVNSCYYDAFPEDENLPGDGGDETELVSYQNDIVPLWVQCTGCHKEGGDLPNLEDNSYNNLLNGYVIPENAAGSILYKSLINDGVELMPPGSGWPAAKINLVKDWINQGAINN
ncbi:MAG: hypothetical protein QM499_12510 [Flavobacteriaceae bacterium]